MEKTGVCKGEGEEPKPTEKAAQDQPKVGSDLLSKLSEEASKPGVKRGDGPEPGKK